jgi:hypothetical protein
MITETETKDLTLTDLSQFYGTENYYKCLNALLTDGVKYVMDNGYSWFITDFIVVAKMKLRNQEFLSITLKLLENDKAKMIITDGNGKILYTQEYKFTTAKRELNFYFADNVMMLTSEY